MPYSVAGLKDALESLHNAGSAALSALDAEFTVSGLISKFYCFICYSFRKNHCILVLQDINSWLDDIQDAVKSGNLRNLRQLTNGPIKKCGALGTINESLNNTPQAGMYFFRFPWMY